MMRRVTFRDRIRFLIGFALVLALGAIVVLLVVR
jgi:hypothetical protein